LLVPGRPRLNQLGMNPSGQPALTLHGAPGLSYDLEASGDLIQWQPRDILHLTNTTLPVTIAATNGHEYFRARYRAE